ncbi:protein PET117 homolog, mitochondrial [Carassius auratus]|uniref:Protein PET117 homolog, mitochondrial n=1 Tax=Carassius auratus TaxID=7957 RepID=A0A6P6M6B9_CARAU|nr:protein PET117 homolog, mitochondrial [Carassius auratus]XP_052395826.1 protein PET117 homolog, mitochondrial [Carassius gibelio]
MSTASKVVLGLSIVLTISTVAGVHIKQNWDRQRLREGVLRDLERAERKRENLRALDEQIQLTRQLVSERDGREAESAPPHNP